MPQGRWLWRIEVALGRCRVLIMILSEYFLSIIVVQLGSTLIEIVHPAVQLDAGTEEGESQPE